MTLHDCKRNLINKAAGTGVTRLLGLDRRDPLILYWHGVEERISNANVQALHTPAKVFEEQIRYLRGSYEIISLDYLHECMVNGRPLDPHQIAITLDDGYRNNLKTAAPIMSAYHVPFAVFVCPNLTAARRRLPAYYLRTAIWGAGKHTLHIAHLENEFALDNEDQRRAAFNIIGNALRSSPLELVAEILGDVKAQIEPDHWLQLNGTYSSDELLTWEEVQALHAGGATIGSHTHDHCILHERQLPATIDSQLNESRKALERICPCKYLAFPHGTMRDIGAIAYQTVKSSGYRMAFAGIGGPASLTVDPHLCPRLGVPDSVDELRYVMNTSHFKTGRYRAWAAGYANGRLEK